MTLKMLEAASPENLAQALNGIRIYGTGMWDAESTLKELERLKEVQVGDGSVQALVTEVAGNWTHGF
jgi:hypothetical protein